jgi:hypothetical protein
LLVKNDELTQDVLRIVAVCDFGALLSQPSRNFNRSQEVCTWASNASPNMA